MIGYTMVGTSDLAKARAFYSPVFAEMGVEEVFSDAQVVSWGDPADETAPRFFACLPFDGAPAGAGNGAMTAFLVAEPARIDRLYRIAMAGGASDEGPPGLRPHYSAGFYAAYVRDPDGNKIAFVCYDAAAGAAPSEPPQSH
ncbi:MAG: VOC family protein [Pseudomonadota bacterium]